MAVGAVFLPGHVVHGAGYEVLGARDTAARLYTAGVAGIGLAALGGLTWGWSNNSRYLAGVSTAVGMTGVALGALSWRVVPRAALGSRG